MEDAQSDEAIRTAFDSGVRYFDTAPWYGIGKSEQRLGRLLPSFERSEILITTKVGRILQKADPGSPAPYQNRWKGGNPLDLRFDYTHDGLLRSLDDSLKRLKVDRVDAAIIHDLDAKFFTTKEELESKLNELEKGGGMKALLRLKERGDLKAIGVGINIASMIPVFLERFPIDFFLVAMPYTLLDQQVLESEFPLCDERGVSVLVGSPFASGVLLNETGVNAQYGQQPASKEIVQKVLSIRQVAERHRVSMLAASLQFPLAHPVVKTVIPGMRSSEEVVSAVAAMEEQIPKDFWLELKESNLIHQNAPIPGA